MFFRANHDKENPYVLINKGFLNDKKLSYKAKGLMALILSFPDGWQIYEADLIKRSKDKRESTHSAIDELIKTGYIKRRENNQERINKGMYAGYNYDVFESKQT